MALNIDDRFEIRNNGFGDIEYRRNGFIHREDGPAVEYHNGKKLWYIDGECFIPSIDTLNNSFLNENYPKFIESMIIYMMHES